MVEHLGHDLHAVDDDQRLLVRAEGRDAANPEIRAVGSGLARRLHGDHTRDASGEGRRQVARGDLQVRGFHGLHGTHEALLFLDTEAHDHHFADAVLGLEELDQLEQDRVVDRNTTGLVAQETERHLVRSRGNVDRVVAVGTGDGAGVRALDIDAGPDDRPAVGRRDDIPAEGPLCGCRGGGFLRRRRCRTDGDLPSPDLIGQPRFFQQSVEGCRDGLCRQTERDAVRGEARPGVVGIDKGVVGLFFDLQERLLQGGVFQVEGDPLHGFGGAERPDPAREEHQCEQDASPADREQAAALHPLVELCHL